METGEKRKEEILESYYQTIRDEGIEGASISKIAKRINMPQSLLFHYFSSKEEMIHELCDYVLHKCKASFFPDELKGDSDREKFRFFIDTLFELRANKAVDATVFYTFLIISFRNKDIARKFHSTYDSYRDIVSYQLKYFSEKGIINISDEYIYADYLLIILEGLAVMNEALVLNKVPQEKERFDKIVELQKRTFLNLVGCS